MAIAGRVAIVPKGEWNSSISYEKLDAVSYDNALYIAKKPSVGQVPTDGEYWMFCLQSIDYAEFEKIINGTTSVGIGGKANKDKNGDDIVDTYAKKNDLTNFQNKDGDSKDNTVTFESSDASTADAWTDVAVLATGEKHSSLFSKISTMFKNIRYIYTHFIKSENILETLEEIVANTQSGKVAGALAVKELNSNLGEHSFSDWINTTQGVSYRYNKQLLEVIVENGTQNFGQWFTLANLPIKPSKTSHTLGWNYDGDVVVGITITTNGDVNVRTLGGNTTIGATGHIICSR